MKKAFTLLELLIVIIIIAILAAIAIPQYLDAIGKAREAEAKGALSEIRKAQLGYQTANNGAYAAVSSGDTIQVNLDNDSANTYEIQLTLPKSSNFNYVTDTTTGIVTANPLNNNKKGWKINIATGELTEFTN